MDTVIHVVLTSVVPGELDLDGFHPSGFPGGAGGLAVGLPALPTHILEMGVVSKGDFSAGIAGGDLDGFHPLGLADGAGGGSLGHPALPADILDMGLVLGLGCDLGRGVARFDGRAFRGAGADQLDFNGFHLDAAILCPGGFAILGPAQPTEVAQVHPVIDAVIGGICTAEADLHRFKLFGFPHGAGGLAVGNGGLPAGPLDLNLVADADAADVGFDFQGFQALGFAGGAGGGPVVHPFLPADVLHVGPVLEVRGGGCLHRGVSRRRRRR